jgi:hypothetical protein
MGCEDVTDRRALRRNSSFEMRYAKKREIVASKSVVIGLSF